MGEAQLTPVALDGLDHRLIAALRQNGRAPFRRLAGQLGVSEATLRNRYARLVEGNVLAVTAVTNPMALGYDATAMLGVSVSGPPETVADELSTWEEAVYVVVVAGRFDLLVEVVAEDRRGLLGIMNRIRALEGVTASETFLYLDLRKYDFSTA
ncbi:MAG: Lrp/AsnC family transcriptional regulator, regulator for asnA, asnC and gidA [Solirubrobacteraceae bacterium]|nr:Lrp/AsnC family transcriptional regulator, regulator for asnA, asnC and gidA [Solirubrobacteraceae bacterium]